MLIIELEVGVWLADGVGDPSRTLVKDNAKKFSDMDIAKKALMSARNYRPFVCASIGRI